MVGFWHHLRNTNQVNNRFKLDRSQLGDDAKNRQYKTILSFNTSSLSRYCCDSIRHPKIHQNGLPIARIRSPSMGNLWLIFARLVREQFGLGERGL